MRISDLGKMLRGERNIGDRLRNLCHKYKLQFGVAFDARNQQLGSNGWQADYAVVDLTVALPSKKGEIPDDLYRDAIEIFKHAGKTLNRSRTYFCLRIVPRLKRQTWSVAMLLTIRDLAARHLLLSRTVADILSLTLRNTSFKQQYSDYAHALCSYSHRNKCLIAFPSEVPITFSDHFADCDSVERVLLSGGCDRNITRMSGVYLGNLNYFFRRHREAIPHWQRAADEGVPEALMSIAGSHAILGNMEKAFQFSKRAIQKGVSRGLLNDPEFAEFRLHPLFAKLKWIRKARPSRPAKPLSPNWSMPKNLMQLVEDGDGTWENERWSPILLTVMSGTSYLNRKIPRVWQLEFDPFVRRFAAASKRLKALSIDPDGYGWSQVIEREFTARYPKFAREFEVDSETSTCVVSVQSESACRKLLELIWSMMHLTIAFP